MTFVDDGTFLFETKEELQRGVEHIYHYFERFGLKMQVGRDDSASKTEVVFYQSMKEASRAEHSTEDERIPVHNRYITTTITFNTTLDPGSTKVSTIPRK